MNNALFEFPESYSQDDDRKTKPELVSELQDLRERLFIAKEDMRGMYNEIKTLSVQASARETSLHRIIKICETISK